ncbi:MAG TPA: hypothetical protein VK550_14545 [Polyangiaceae bacterium]|nr:hypothetical protein [Polyangiaceae bacterium]
MANSRALLAAQASGDPTAHRLATELALDILQAAPADAETAESEVAG